MTQSEDLTRAPEGGYTEDWLDEQWQDQYGDQYEDWSDDQYDDEYVYWYEPPVPVRRPWHRNPAVLIGLIAAASTALVVAAVLLLAGDPADSPTRLKPIISTTAVSVPPSDEPPAAGEPTIAESAAETTSATGPESATAEGDVPEAGAPAEAPAEAPAQPPISARDDGSGDSEGPRINVTRSPMSFTPGA